MPLNLSAESEYYTVLLLKFNSVLFNYLQLTLLNAIRNVHTEGNLIFSKLKASWLTHVQRCSSDIAVV